MAIARTYNQVVIILVSKIYGHSCSFRFGGKKAVSGDWCHNTKLEMLNGDFMMFEAVLVNATLLNPDAHKGCERKKMMHIHKQAYSEARVKSVQKQSTA